MFSYGKNMLLQLSSNWTKGKSNSSQDTQLSSFREEMELPVCPRNTLSVAGKNVKCGSAEKGMETGKAHVWQEFQANV